MKTTCIEYGGFLNGMKCLDTLWPQTPISRGNRNLKQARARGALEMSGMMIRLSFFSTAPSGPRLAKHVVFGCRKIGVVVGFAVRGVCGGVPVLGIGIVPG